MKKVLVAGGSGFIGSHLVDLLLSKGHFVVVIDSYVTGSEKNLAHLKGRDDLKIIKHDVRDEIPDVGEIDHVYNLASPASPKDFATIGIYILETGAIGHLNLLRFCKKKNARILLASTSEVYGDPEVHPQTESYYGNVNPIGERACYDEAKRFGESLSVNFQREQGVEVRIARIFNTYGPRMNPEDGRIIPNFFSQAIANQPLTVYGEGTQTRSYCFVTDMAQGLYDLMNSDESTPVNIGNSIERTVKEMADIINQLTGNTAGTKNLPLPENDPKLRKPDTTKAEKAFGWNPQIKLEQGLNETYAFFKKVLS